MWSSQPLRVTPTRHVYPSQRYDSCLMAPDSDHKRPPWRDKGHSLREDRRDQRVDRLRPCGTEFLGNVAGEMDPATLPSGAGQDRLDGGFQAGVRVAGDPGHAERIGVGGDFQSAVTQGAEELGPEVGGLRLMPVSLPSARIS